ncbi:class I SAM-dependent methyltransferase [Lutibacter flavus]|uniref:Methyltransferase domain-containing protein n=1 Tax=Lutibacter flavus TaxID=691689 RepID=A0A238YZ58_9FLAO|nr:class I SAM-dependent methyltransferase [Lutibacter flavus]SNR75954.1 Methyltransferase domain-containing protein [Lutibacter flavus]
MKSKESSSEEYWKLNFNNDKIVNATDDLQVNIARTKNGKRVENKIWTKTLSYLTEILSIDKNSNVLELCCGNGVIIGELSKSCRNAYGIDYSKTLLNQLSKQYKNENLKTKLGDVNTVKLDIEMYNAIIIYFSLQHFNERDAFLLIEKSIESLKLGGKILIGDIPDLDKKWDYINKPIYCKDYFNRLKERRPKIGYWFQKEFFLAMNNCFPHTEFKIINQPDYQINSDHCFDILIEKNEII